jgi:hypothetical protein
MKTLASLKKGRNFFILFLLLVTVWQSFANARLCREVFNEYSIGAVPHEGLVEKFVPGLYESIPETSVVQFTWGKMVTTRDVGSSNPNHVYLETKIYDNDGAKVGEAKRNFDALTGILKLDNIFIRYESAGKVPNFVHVEGGIDLVPGKGVPIASFITMMQMKLAAIKPGQVREVRIDDISNVRTTLQVLRNPGLRDWVQVNENEGEPIPESLFTANLFGGTNTGRYLQTVLTQTGYTIEKFDAELGFTETLQSLLEGDSAAAADGAVQTLAKGLSPDLIVPSSIAVKITVRPITAQSN